MMLDGSCAQCRFWQKPEHPVDDAGECRRHAPHAANQITLWHGEIILAIANILCRQSGLEWPPGIEPEPTETTANATFPKTCPDYWCGEFQPDA
jgi:hypothetical protein